MATCAGSGCVREVHQAGAEFLQVAHGDGAQWLGGEGANARRSMA